MGHPPTRCLYPRALTCNGPGKVLGDHSRWYYANSLVSRSSFEFCLFCATERELRLTEMIDHRKAAFAIIRNSNVPCQVRHSPPSYDRLRLSDRIYSFFSFQLHANIRALHNYTLQEKKKAARGEGPGFDGELNNFQAPQLSSLAKLVSILLFGYCKPLMTVIRT